jgi:hypothetical protein
VRCEACGLPVFHKLTAYGEPVAITPLPYGDMFRMDPDSQVVEKVLPHRYAVRHEIVCNEWSKNNVKSECET